MKWPLCFLSDGGEGSGAALYAHSYSIQYSQYIQNFHEVTAPVAC